MGWRFLGCHRTAYAASPVLLLQHFSASVWGWDKRFPPHEIHESMLEEPSCGREVHNDPKKTTATSKKGNRSQENKDRTKAIKQRFFDLLLNSGDGGSRSSVYSLGSLAAPRLPIFSFIVRIFSVANNLEAMYMMTTVKTATYTIPKRTVA